MLVFVTTMPHAFVGSIRYSPYHFWWGSTKTQTLWELFALAPLYYHRKYSIVLNPWQSNTKILKLYNLLSLFINQDLIVTNFFKFLKQLIWKCLAFVYKIWNFMEMVLLKMLIVYLFLNGNFIHFLFDDTQISGRN